MGTQKHVLEWMKTNPKKLVTCVDISNKFKINTNRASTIMWRLHNDESIVRHIDKTDDGRFQYAVSISAKLKDVYQSTPADTSSNGNGVKRSYTKRGNYNKRSKTQLTPKELRAMFAQTMSNLAKLEDAVMGMAEEHDSMAKRVAKVEELLKGF